MKQNNVNYEQQQLYSLLPLGEGGRRPDEGLKETVRCNSDEMLKQVQHDGKGLAKDAQSQCPPLETLPNKNNPVDCFCERKPEFSIPRRGSERSELLTPHQVRTKLAKRSLSPTILSPKGEGYDETRHKATGTNSCNHLITQSLSHLITSKAAAFTLAEVLITLAVIGIVAALTLPGLIQNHNEKAWSTAQDVFTKRLEVATRQMNTEEKLAGYSSTMDFVNELKKYIKITNVCDSDNLSKCFEKNIMSVDNRYVDTSSLKTSAQLAKEDWGTETVGVQFANGINALIAYNTQTDQQPFNNQFSASAASMAILYDVSGNKNPNIIGKDINQNANVKTLGCMIQPDLVGGMCISQILAPGTGYSPMTYEECRQAKENGEIDVEYCYDGSYGGNDYFAGAVKACGGKKANLPTMAQLGELATYVYNHDSTIGAEQNVSSLTLDTTKASQFLSASPDSDRFFVWSEQENVSSYARGRYFSSTGTYWNSNLGNRFSSDGLAVCLGD